MAVEKAGGALKVSTKIHISLVFVRFRGYFPAMQEDSSKGKLGERKGASVDLTKWRNHRSYKHRVRWVEGGKRREKGFKVKKDAEAFQKEKEEELSKHGTEGAPTAEERAAIIENRAMLADAGLSLREAIAMALEVHERDSRSVTVSEAVSAVINLKKKKGKSDRHLADLRHRLGSFEDVFEKRLLSTITDDEVSTWIESRSDSAVSRNNFRRHVRLLFNHAKKRGFCDRNPIDLVEPWKETKKEVSALTPEQLSELLEKAPAEMIPAIAVGAFAGLRRSEIERLNWSEVDFESGEIYVRALNEKSAANRFVKIEDNLAKWLQPCAKSSGSVWPRGGAVRFTALKKAASFEVPHNALRHSYGSYHMAKYKDGALTSLNLGHPNQRQVFESYRKPIKAALVSAYWNIVPDGAVNVIPMEGAA